MLDLNNLNFWRFYYDVLCVDANGTPCTPLRPYLVGDYVWYDANGDGFQNDGSNAGIAGVVVNLLDSNGNLIATTTTDATGYYSFEVAGRRVDSVLVNGVFQDVVIVDGEYTVQIAPENFNSGGALFGLRPTVDYSVPPDGVGDNERTQTVINQNVLTYDFGYIFEGQGSGAASIGNQIWLDSNSNGIYEPGLGEAGIAGVTVALYYDYDGDGVYETLVGTTTTDQHGEYFFYDLADGKYQVDVTDVYGALTGLTLTSGPFPGQNNSSQTDPYKLEISNQTDNLTADFGYIGSASIGDFVWEDTNGNGVQDASESGLAGVTVELHDNEGNLKGTDITDANGNYSFYVMPGVYYVRFMPPTGYSFSPQDKGDDDAKDSDAATTGQTIMTTLVFGENDLTWDAGLYRPATLGDYVWEDLDADGIQDDGEFGIANAKVELYDSAGNLVATTHTDGSGFYSFTGLMPGDYYLVFTAPTGYFFSPQDQGGDDTKDSDANASGQTTVTSLTSGENDTTWDAGLYQLASIGDFVWLDSDRDGVQEPEVGELGLAGVTVKLYTSTGTLVASTTTGVNGQYLFSNLMPGSYYLVFTAPSGYLFTLHDQGTNDAKDSDANPANGMTAVTSLTSGENDLTWDAGLYLRTSPGVGTPGYWKNHPEAWPVQSITIGGVTYTKELAISWMSRDNRRDKTITMFRSLVAAKLNVAIGNLSSCIEDTIRAADAWMAQYGPVGSGVRGNSDAWKAGEPLYLKLDDYNNGKLCAPARD